MKIILSINYIFWLILSAIFFAIGEFLSKKFVLNPKSTLLILLLCVSPLEMLFWLPAILQKNQLSIVGVMWSVFSLLTTALIGILIFGEKLSLIGIIGILTAIASIILLSMS